MFRKLFLCLTLLGLVACSSHHSNEPTEIVHAAIKGGTPDATDTEVVGLFRESAPIIVGSAACTATLIAPNVALTARHCIEDFTGLGCSATFAGYVYPHVWVTTAADSEASGKKMYKAASVQRPNTDAGLCDNDLALVVLNDVVPSTEATPRAPLIGAAITSGDKFSAVGYGGDDSIGSNDGHRLRYDGTVVFCTGQNCGFGNPREWYGTAPLCPGDSGGPALDASGRVSGVASRGDCGGATYTRVECFAEFLKSTVKAAATQGGYTAPAWTEQPSGAPSPGCESLIGTGGGGGGGGLPNFGGAAGVGGAAGFGATGGIATGGAGGSGAAAFGGASSGGAPSFGGMGNVANAAGSQHDAGDNESLAAAGDSGSCAHRVPGPGSSGPAPLVVAHLLLAFALYRRRLAMG